MNRNMMAGRAFNEDMRNRGPVRQNLQASKNENGLVNMPWDGHNLTI